MSAVPPVPRRVELGAVTVLVGHVLDVLADVPDASVHSIVTSPPYWGLRDYGCAPIDWPAVEYSPIWYLPPVRVEATRCALGLEPDVVSFIAHMVLVFRGLRRVLRDDGTCWVNIGSNYATGTNAPRGASIERDGQDKPAGWTNRCESTRRSPEGLAAKQLVHQPSLLALALQADGWIWRSDIVWCLSGGARVYARTQSGDMSITVKDLVRLDPSTVSLWNGEKWTRVLGWGRTSDRGCPLEIELRSGERIGCTPGHLWPTQRGNVRADELTRDDVIATCRLPEPNDPASPSCLPDDEIGWFVGLYIAEGSRDSKGMIQIASHVDESARFARLRALAEAFHGTARVHQTGGKTATCNIACTPLAGVLEAYVAGRTAKDKHLKTRAWQRSNAFIRAVLDGYLSGDGHFDAVNNRWRLGFCANDALAADLRTMGARVGARVTLRRAMHAFNGRKFPGWRGELRFVVNDHHNTRNPGEVVAVRRGRGRAFWDIAVADEPHLFALASGVLTHNCKPNPMPEAVTDRPTVSHEQVFLFAKSPKYFYDAPAISEAIEHPDAAQPEDAARAFSRRRATTVEPRQGDVEVKLYRSGNKKAVTGHDRGRPGDHRQASIPWTDTTGRRNARSVWKIATAPFKGAHFATFPPELARRCIVAGTSARGACAACGAPWRRDVEREFVPQADVSPERAVRGADGQKPLDETNHRQGYPRGTTTTTTTGWSPTCGCGAAVVPCTVLDPFGGSGTTGAVAKTHGRVAVLCEAQPGYLPLIARRIAAAPAYQPTLGGVR